MLKLFDNSSRQHQLGDKLILKERGMSATRIQAQYKVQAQEDGASALDGSQLVSVTREYMYSSSWLVEVGLVDTALPLA